MDAMPPILVHLVRVAAICGAGWLAIAIELAPAGGAWRMVPAPDLLFCVLALWAVRRPGAVPVVLVFGLGLLRDVLGGGAVGAGALALMLAVEGLRRHAPALHRRSFVAEWLVVGLWAAALLGLHWLVLGIVFAPTPLAGDLGLRLGVTVLAYPVVALVLRPAVRPGPRAGADGPSAYGRGT